MPIEFHFGIHTSTCDPNRPLWQQVDETVELVHAMRDVGTFARISFQHHWLSYPTVWIEPLPFIARLAPETGRMRLLTSVLKLPLHNP
ncbi:MAG: LLM class flavin-dependent oxidoreductase, partial [Chloroflexi bacterium]|nr:LLM class flavin-dependent oxidoreductase [Chloroflexota bacterium]